MGDKFVMIHYVAGERVSTEFDTHGEMLEFIKRPSTVFAGSIWPDWARVKNAADKNP